MISSMLGPRPGRSRDFADRVDAGRRLARALTHLAGDDVVVLGLPRGGIPVAREVAQAIGAPLDVIIVRKLGAPWQPELAVGAIGEGGVRVVNRSVTAQLGLTDDEIGAVERRERAELARRVKVLRGGRPMLDLTGKTALIVDDGIATGATAEAACSVARAHGARRIVLAVPVASIAAVDALRAHADEVVSLATPADFAAVGQFYTDFSPVPDSAVQEILRSFGTDDRSEPEPVRIVSGDVALPGLLAIPGGASSLVIFAHGSGSSMRSPRNRWVAEQLNERGHATLRFDLLTEPEANDRRKVFDIDLLAGRLVTATDWASSHPSSRHLTPAYFGASTGAAAALAAAARVGAGVGAIVSRGGRPDLAADHLPSVRSPTLLIVGGADQEVLELNRMAAAQLRCVREVAVVPGAGHLFEEPGALDRVAALAGEWFDRHVGGGRL
jgi:putative phosphoribosyl transferase